MYNVPLVFHSESVQILVYFIVLFHASYQYRVHILE